MFPSVGSPTEKNWNLLRVEAHKLLIEYHIEPHIVLEAHLGVAPGGHLALTSLSTLAVSRWPPEILHSISNVRGGYCCVELPPGIYQRHRDDVDQDEISAVPDDEP